MKAKHVVLVLVSTGLISSQALAAEAGIQGASSVQTQEAFTEADAANLFEQSNKPMQVAALSSTEMKKTQGAFLPVLGAMALGAVGGAFGRALIHATVRGAQGLPVTTRGIRIAAASGAVTGAIGGPLIGASGGGVVGNVAWRPAMFAANNSIQRATNGVMGNK